MTRRDFIAATAGVTAGIALGNANTAVTQLTETRNILPAVKGGKDSDVKNNGAFLNTTDAKGNTRYVGFTENHNAAQIWKAGGAEPSDIIKPFTLG